MRCGDCKFYLFRNDEGKPIEQCRRHAPRVDLKIETHNSELLRDVVWSLRALVKDAPPDNEEFDPINKSALDWDENRWPYTDEDDWCGEFQPANAQADQRACEHCGGSFVAGVKRRIVAKFCSDKCRVAFNNARRGK